MSEDKLRMSYRYGAKQEAHFKELFALQSWSTKKSEAINDALEIAAAVVKAFKKNNPKLDSWDFRYKFKDLVDYSALGLPVKKKKARKKAKK